MVNLAFKGPVGGKGDLLMFIISSLLPSGATATTRGSLGLGLGPILFDNLMCTGLESRLIDCVHNGIGIEDCTHFEDAGVICLPGTRER